MRCGVVTSSLLAKHKRWDAAFYLGDKEIVSGANVAKAEENLQRAQTRLDHAKQERQDELDRIARLEATGEIKIIKDSAYVDSPAPPS